MTDRIDLGSMKKFDGENYSAWKFQITNALLAQDLMKYVDGTATGKEDTDTKIKTTWVSGNAKAMYVIGSTLDSKILDLVLMYNTSQDMFNHIKSIYERTDECSRLLVQQNWCSYRMDSNDSMVQHIAKVKKLAGQVKDTGEPCTDVAMMAKILAGLPPKYAGFATAWDSVAKGEQKLEVLESRLMKEEQRLKVTESSGVALVAGHGNSFADRRGNAHGRMKGKRPMQQHEKAGGRFKGVKCFKCGKLGHIQVNCFSGAKGPNFSRGEKWNGAPARGRFEQRRTEEDLAFVASTTEKPTATCQSAQNKQESVPEEGALLAQARALEWIADSGATKHMTPNKQWFSELKPVDDLPSIRVGNGAELSVKGIGTVRIKRLVYGEWSEMLIKDVHYVPGLSRSLFSISACAEKNFKTVLDKEKCELFYEGKLQGVGVHDKRSNLFKMLFKVETNFEAHVADVNSLKMWHERLGHVNYADVKEMIKKGYLVGNLKDKEEFCEACQLGKQNKASYKDVQRTYGKKPGEYIHSDLCGPFQTEARNGARYFVLFKDDYSGYRKVYFMRDKADTFNKFRIFNQLIKNQFGYNIKTLRSDNGTEYMNNQMQSYMQEHGITHEVSAPYTPEQNGRAEREMRTLVEAARTMLFAKNLPKYLWADAVDCAAFTRNRTPSRRADGKIPVKLFLAKDTDYKQMKVFGCDCYMMVPYEKRKKLDAKSEKKIFIGYAGDGTTYKVYDPETRKVDESKNVRFNENSQTQENTDAKGVKMFVDSNERQETTHANPDSGSDADEHSSVSETPNNVNPDDEYIDDDPPGQAQTPTIRRPRKQYQVNMERKCSLRKQPTPSRPYWRNPDDDDFEANITEYSEPTTLAEALDGSDAEKWKIAVNEEINSLVKNEVFSEVKLPEHARAIDCKWVLKIKRDANGEVNRYKARLCAKGFAQKPGIDYHEIYSPVARYESIRTLLAIAAIEDLEIMQFDVKTAFLYGELKEEIYMKIPEGIINNEGNVWKLHKSLYGLKQAPRCWNKKFNEFLSKHKFERSNADRCIYTAEVNEEIVYLVLYVDDGLLFANTKQTLCYILDEMEKHFEITVGEANYFVGIEITRDREKKQIKIGQKEYLTRVLERFGMADCKSLAVPADPYVKLSDLDGPSNKDEEDEAKNFPYQEAVGSLMYAAHGTRPDIVYAVGIASRFNSNYGRLHWNGVKRILQYLRGTLDYGIIYDGTDTTDLHGFTDADFANDSDERRSTGGYVFMLAGGPITWRSKKQDKVAQSTCEAEYYAACEASNEACHLRQLFRDLWINVDKPTKLMIDNQGAIKLTKNPEFHGRTKHIEVKYHVIRERVEDGTVEPIFVPSAGQLADALTKALPRVKFLNFRDGLKMDRIE